MKRFLIAIFAMLAVAGASAQMTSKEDYEVQKPNYIINNGITKFKLWFVNDVNLCMFSQEHVKFCDPTLSSPTLGIYTDCMRTGGINYRDARGIMANFAKINDKDWYELECGSVVGRYDDGDFFIIVKPHICKFKNKIERQKFIDVIKKLDEIQKAIEQIQ